MNPDQLAAEQQNESIPDIFADIDSLRIKAIRAFRLGAEGEGNDWLVRYIDRVMFYLNHKARLINGDNFNLVISELLLAQQRVDTVRTADLLEYEFPICGLEPESVQVTGIDVSIDPPSPQPVGTELLIKAQARGGTGEYEYRFIVLQPGFNVYHDIKKYDRKNQCVWKMPDEPGNYHIRIWARCAHPQPRLTQAVVKFDYELMPLTTNFKRPASEADLD